MDNVELSVFHDAWITLKELIRQVDKLFLEFDPTLTEDLTEKQAAKASKKNTRKNKGTQKKNEKKVNFDVSERKKEKLQKMRTSSDVISRIKWDESLPQEEFVVGYLDRFLGIVEKPFTEFYWGNLCDVDWEDLAIPKHRIKYFRYKGRKVWDRKEKIDLIFNSFGGKSNIYDVIAEENQKLHD